MTDIGWICVIVTIGAAVPCSVREVRLGLLQGCLMRAGQVARSVCRVDRLAFDKPICWIVPVTCVCTSTTFQGSTDPMPASMTERHRSEPWPY
jgi:hypothetical protein